MTGRASRARRITRRVTHAIDRGADAVEAIHQKVARLPLTALRQVDFLESPLDDVQRVQERSIGAVYDLVRGINQDLGALSNQLLLVRRPLKKRVPRARRRAAPQKPAAAATQAA